MADQSMRITNMPESGSPERVAYDLLARIKTMSTGGLYASKDAILDLYAECLVATKGHRAIK